MEFRPFDLACMRVGMWLSVYFLSGLQVKGWPRQPVDVAAAWLDKLPSGLVVADFGCGDAKLSRSVKQVRPFLSGERGGERRQRC